MVEPPKEEWMCLSCRFYNPDKPDQWKDPPCNKCCSKEGIKWEPKNVNGTRVAR